MALITIDGREFDLDKLSGEAPKQAHNADVIDVELARLHTQVLIPPDGTKRLQHGLAAGPKKRAKKPE